MSKNRNAINQARDLIMRGSGEYGALLTKLPGERADGSVDHFCVVSPFAFLSEACAAGGGFAKAMRRIIAERPPSMDAPWDLVVYSDEVVPGNQLSGHNQRKAWAVYISCVQLGPLLTDEGAWLCLVCERTDKLKTYGGGIAQVFGALLKTMFSTTGSQFRCRSRSELPRRLEHKALRQAHHDTAGRRRPQPGLLCEG